MNVFKQFYKSIYSPKDIAAYRFQGIGKTILYVFLLTLVSIMPSVFFISSSITAGIDSARTVIKNELPDFTIDNGLLKAKTNVPVTINKKNITIVLDPTGAVSSKELAGTDNTFAILKKEFVFIAGGKTETYSYSMLNGVKITTNDLLHFLNALNGAKMFIIPCISIVLYLFSSAASFIEISILALFGFAIKNFADRRLNYKQLWTMTAYSETLSTLFFTIMAAIKTSVPLGFLINCLVVLIVLYLSVNEVPKQKTSI